MARAHGIMPETIDGVRRGMKAVLRSSVDVLLLRAGPQAFPRSRLLLLSMLLAYFLTDVLDAWIEGYRAAPMMLQSVVDTGLWVSFYVLLLSGWSVLPRLPQTLTAWFSAGVIFNFLWVPVDGAVRFLASPDAQGWLTLPVLLLVVWSMMVMAYLLRHTLRVGLLVTVPVAVVCGLIAILLLSYMFPLA